MKRCEKNYLEDGCHLLFPIPFVIVAVISIIQLSFLLNKNSGCGGKYINAVAWRDRSDIQLDACGGWDSLSKKWTMHCCLHQRILSTSRNVHLEFKQLPPIGARKQLDQFLSHQPPGRKTTIVPTSLQFSYLWSTWAWKRLSRKRLSRKVLNWVPFGVLWQNLAPPTTPPVTRKTWTIPLSSSLLSLCYSSLLI